MENFILTRLTQLLPILMIKVLMAAGKYYQEKIMHGMKSNIVQLPCGNAEILKH